jgi:hypothetical protein
MTDRTLIDQIKNAYTVADAWHALALPGTPARCCRIPWAEKDTRPSFSVFQDGQRWFNHRDGTGGDVLDFVKEATGMNTTDAVRWCAARAGLRCGDDAPDAQPRMRRQPPRRQMPERAPEAWPTLRAGTAAEKKALAELRGFSIGGIELAESRGLLHFGIYDAACPWRQHWKGAAFWAVTDAARRLVELRRMDGKHWPEKDGTAHRKAHTIGHGKDHPCGIVEAAQFPIIGLVEGAPDLIAAHDLLTQMGEPERVGVAAILGAGVSRLAAECLHHFKAKHVRLYPHHDEHGLRAARQWAEQIKEADAALVDAFDLSGITTKNDTPGKDLADLINLHPACQRANPELLNDLFP